MSNPYLMLNELVQGQGIMPQPLQVSFFHDRPRVQLKSLCLPIQDERCVSLVREHIDTVNEHWALFISTPPTGSGSTSRPYAADGYLVEPVWDGHSNAPLAVDSRGPFHRTYPFQVGADLKTMVPLGCAATVAEMQHLLNLAWADAAPTEEPREENCTVFVKNALRTMNHEDPAIRYDLFRPIYSANYATVKHNTDPYFTYPR